METGFSLGTKMYSNQAINLLTKNYVGSSTAAGGSEASEIINYAIKKVHITR